MEKKDINNEDSNAKFDNLEKKINDLGRDVFYSYKKNEDGSFSAVVNGVELDNKFLSQEKLLEGLKFIDYLINTYNKLETKGKLYAGEGFISKSFASNKVDIFVDNRSGINEKIHLGDTTFLSGESIEKFFGLKDSVDKMETQKIADFLNEVLFQKSQ